MSQEALPNGVEVTRLENGVEETKFPSGAKATTFVGPADEDFSILSVEDTLLRHGLSVDAIKDLKSRPLFADLLGRPGQFVTPQFRLVEGKFHGPRIDSNNWSGAVVFGSLINVAWGAWTVPNPYPGAADGTWYYCSSWIGIDGDGSPDVCQAGVECRASSTSGVVTRDVYLWWEWYPEQEVAIQNFPVSPGDRVLWNIVSSNISSATMFFGNANSGLCTVFQVTAPPGTFLIGNCAEWIVETPNVDNVLTNLAKYGAVYFDFAMAGDRGGNSLAAGSGDTLTMERSGKVLSTGVIENDVLIGCFYST